MKTTLYRTSKGKNLEWTVEVEGAKHRVTSGQVDGKLHSSEWTTCLPKNVGKANETSPEQQALLEAEAMVTKKRDKGYADSISASAAIKQKTIDVTLAHSYEKHAKKVDWASAWATPKLDGVRCRADKTGLYTRNNKPIHGVPHIFDALKPLFDKHPDLVLDGELYAHVFATDFNSLVSIVKKAKPSAEELETAKALNYEVFDYVDSADYRKRTWAIWNLLAGLSDYVQALMPVKVNSEEEATEAEGLYIGEGYEGAMLRWGSDGYIEGRTDKLLKLKRFQDQEFEITAVIEGTGNRSGMLGKFVLLNPVNKSTFEANAIGDFDIYKEMLQRKDELIGKMATVKFQNLTPALVPRFPVVKTIRDYE